MEEEVLLCEIPVVPDVAAYYQFAYSLKKGTALTFCHMRLPDLLVHRLLPTTTHYSTGHKYVYGLGYARLDYFFKLPS